MSDLSVAFSSLFVIFAKKSRMKKVRPKKNLGQHFLLDLNIARRIADTVINSTETPKFSRRVKRDTIIENDYNLNIPRYVDSSDVL